MRRPIYHIIALVELVVLEIVAVYTVWIQLFYNGSFEFMRALRLDGGVEGVRLCPHVINGNVEAFKAGTNLGPEGGIGGLSEIVESFWDFFIGLECAWGAMVVSFEIRR